MEKRRTIVTLIAVFLPALAFVAVGLATNKSWPPIVQPPSDVSATQALPGAPPSSRTATHAQSPSADWSPPAHFDFAKAPVTVDESRHYRAQVAKERDNFRAYATYPYNSRPLDEATFRSVNPARKIESKRRAIHPGVAPSEDKDAVSGHLVVNTVNLFDGTNLELNLVVTAADETRDGHRLQAYSPRVIIQSPRGVLFEQSLSEGSTREYTLSTPLPSTAFRNLEGQEHASLRIEFDHEAPSHPSSRKRGAVGLIVTLDSRPVLQNLAVVREAIVDGSLEIAVQAAATANAKCYLRAILRDANRPVVMAKAQVEATRGATHEVTFTFFGKALRDMNANGPYVVRTISGYCQTPEWERAIPVTNVAFTTKVYSLDQFSDKVWQSPGKQERLALYEQLEVVAETAAF